MPVMPPNPSGIGFREATLEDFEVAAPEKYSAGLELITHPTQNYQGAGVYLLGYVAEMLLKSAYFRLIAGVSVSARNYVIDKARRDAAGTEAKRLARQVGLTPPVEPESFHSLAFWAFLLRETRIERRQAWTDAEFDLHFRSCVDRLHNNWRVSMRYFPDMALTLDAEVVSEDVSWLLDNYDQLWG